MDREKWNKQIFDSICLVNKCLYKGNPPAHAGALLYSIQCGLCSGDGLSTASPFKAESRLVAERILRLLGMEESIRACRTQGSNLIVELESNPFAIDALHFSIRSDKTE